VLIEEAGEESLYDVWIAGGLGREPQAGLLFADRVLESELLPLAESIVEVYKAWGEKGRRLKHLLNAVGEEELRSRIMQRRELKSAVSFKDAFPKNLVPDDRSCHVKLNIFAGEFPVSQLARVVELAADHGCRWLLVTPDQNLELLLDGPTAALEEELARAGFKTGDEWSTLRICPGNHECRMGLCATRDLARRLQDVFGPQLSKRSLAISGCRNSCAQPQLAEIGILSSKLQREGEGRIPLFDLYRNSGEGLGQQVASELSEDALFECLRNLLQD